MRLICLLMLILLPGLLIAERCSGGWVCVVMEEHGDRVEVYAENLKHWPLTISLRMSGRSWNRGDRATVTKTIPGNSKLLLKDLPSGKPDYRYWFDWTAGSLDVDHDDQYDYRLPYEKGQTYTVLQGFGSSFSHTGLERYTVDFNMKVGTAVNAARSGVVVMLEEDNSKGCWENSCSKYANYLVILHDDGSTGEYYHLAKNGVLVEMGEVVTRGQLIARSGNTGHTTMPHLHFGVYKASSWGRTRSLKFRFMSRDGRIARPRPGRHYYVE